MRAGFRGIDVAELTCRNNSTLQVIDESYPGRAFVLEVDCIDLGLLVEPGQDVGVTAIGRNIRTALNGYVEGPALAGSVRATCRNLVTGERVTVPADDDGEWDCVTEGFSAETGDLVFISGRAEYGDPEAR